MCSDRPQDPAAPPTLPFEMFTERVLNETKLPWQQKKPVHYSSYTARNRYT